MDRKRSRSYPGSALADCVANVRAVQHKLGPGNHSREHISDALGSPQVTGASSRKIGAMVSFGLLSKSTDGYAVTDLARRIMKPLPGEEPTLLRRAFFEVDLYQEVLEAYQGEAKLPDALPVILERKFGIAHGIGDLAARILRESAVTAGVITFDGSFINDSNNDIREVEGPTRDVAEREADSNIGKHDRDRITIELPRPNVVFTAPRELTRAQIMRIEAWIDQVLKPQFQFLVEESINSDRDEDFE